MNRKIVNILEPKTFEEVKTYWAWKKIDLERTINILNKVPKMSEEWNAPIQEAITDRVVQLRLIESLIRRHKYGEF